MKSYQNDPTEAAPKSGFFHGWFAAGVIFAGDSMMRPVAFKTNVIGGNYTMVAAFGGKKLSYILDQLLKFVSNNEPFLIPGCPSPRELIVIGGGTNDIGYMAEMWDPVIPEQWGLQVLSLFATVRDWVLQNRNFAKRFLIVGILNRFDPARSSKLPHSEFVEVLIGSVVHFDVFW